MMNSPRRHHYALAHGALRAFAFANPPLCVGGLSSPDGPALLSRLWSDVCEHCGTDEPDFDLSDVKLHRLRAGGYPCVVVQMPPPRAMTEVYYIAVVLIAKSYEEAVDPGRRAVRFITLEYTMNFSGESGTVLCEWTKEGKHKNFGDGPKPNLDDFLYAVAGMVAE